MNKTTDAIFTAVGFRLRNDAIKLYQHYMSIGLDPCNIDYNLMANANLTVGSANQWLKDSPMGENNFSGIQRWNNMPWTIELAELLREIANQFIMISCLPTRGATLVVLDWIESGCDGRLDLGAENALGSITLSDSSKSRLLEIRKMKQGWIVCGDDLEESEFSEILVTESQLSIYRSDNQWRNFLV